MIYIILIAATFMVGCGPSWSDVIKHPDGTMEDPKSGDCWRDGATGPVPVTCPSKK